MDLVKLKRSRRLELRVEQLATLFTLPAGGSITLDALDFDNETEGLATRPPRPLKLVAVVLDRGPDGVIGIFDHDPSKDGQGMRAAMQRASSPTAAPVTPATSQGQAAAAPAAEPSEAATRPDIHPAATPAPAAEPTPKP